MRIHLYALRGPVTSITSGEGKEMEKEELDFIYNLIYTRALKWGNDEQRAQDLARDSVFRHFSEGGVDDMHSPIGWGHK